MGSSKRTTTRKRVRRAPVPRQALRQTTQHPERLIDLTSEWYWEQDEHYRFTRITGAALEGSGLNAPIDLGTARWDHGASPLGDGGKWDDHKAVLAARRPFADFVFKRPNPSGELRYIGSSGRPVFDHRGRFRGYCGVSRDVTRHIQMELRLRIEHGVTEILAEADDFVAAVPRIIRLVCETLGWACGTRWEVDERNNTLRCAETWGCGSTQVEEFLTTTARLPAQTADGGGLVRATWAKSESMWIPDVTADRTFRRAPDAITAGLHSAFAFPIKAGAQVAGVMEFFSSEIYQPDVELLKCTTYIGSQMGQFIQRKRAEAALHESIARFRDLTELPSDWYWEQDENLRFTQFSGHGLRTARIDTTEWFGKTRWEISGLVVDPAARAAVVAKIEAREPFYDFEYQRVEPDGNVRWITTSGMPVFDAAGRFAGYRGIGKDISVRRRGEQLLALEHAVNRCLADAKSISDGIKASLRAICETEGWACGRYLHVDSRAGVLRSAEAWGIHDEKIDRYIETSRAVTYKPGAGIVGRVWQSGEPLWIPDTTQDSRVARAALACEAELRGAFAVPIRSEGTTIGVIIFHSHDLREPDDRLLQTMRVIGSQIGQFVQRKQAEADLRESEERFRAIVNSANEGILVYDRSLQVIGGNAVAERIIGLPLADIIGAAGFTSLLPCVHQDGSALKPEDRPTRITVRSGQPQTGRILGIKRPDGSVTWLSVNTGFLRRGNEPEHYGVVSTFGDVSERIRAEAATLRFSRMFAALSDTNEAILRAQSPEELYQRVCEAAVRGGGKFYSAALFLVEPNSPWLRLAAASGAIADVWRQARLAIDEKYPEGRGLTGTAFRTQKPQVCNDYLNDERTRPWHKLVEGVGVQANAVLPLIRQGNSVGALILYSKEKDAFDDEMIKLLERLTENLAFALDNFDREIERKNAQERIQHLATHDGLTDLPNRVMFGQLLNVAIRSARRYGHGFAVLFLDLDRFKTINDTLGHGAGDTLLKEIARRVRDTLRDSDIVARFGGDEFVVLLQELTEPQQVATVAHKLLAAVIRPTVILGQECRVTASIGISMYPADAQDDQTLMKNADLAMYFAKEEGKNNFQFYSKNIRTQSLEHLTLEMSLRRAIEEEQFVLHYQAKLDLKTGVITGVEALVRWQHPDLGLVSPAQFIALAEETGLIVPIGQWVLKTACAQNMAWQRTGLPPIGMAVNLSPRQFYDENLLPDLTAVLRETGMPPALLELEITESMVMGNVDRATKLLDAIKQMGVRLAIDDFGTGYSSLAQIKRFPIDTIKVDQSFIREIPKLAEDQAIAKAIIAMGKTLGLTVVAEGVETAEQQAFLREHACDEMQGYYFSKPVEPEEFAKLLRTYGTGSDHRAMRVIG